MDDPLLTLFGVMMFFIYIVAMVGLIICLSGLLG